MQYYASPIEGSGRTRLGSKVEQIKDVFDYLSEKLKIKHSSSDESACSGPSINERFCLNPFILGVLIGKLKVAFKFLEDS